MDVCLVIKQRLEELGLEQRDLAAAAEVTDSYISQLLTRKKLPPAPGRTDIYDKMGEFLKLPSGKLAKLAEHQRKEELKRNLGDPPTPLFKEVRELWGFRTMPIGVPRHADHRFRVDGDHDSGMMPITRSGMIPIS